jgi:hypothetical protein
MLKSEEIKDLAAALAKAQGEIKGAVKDSSNPFFKSTYADLASVWEACRGPLAKNGLSIVQAPMPSDYGLCLETILIHASGQWIASVLPIKAIAETPQAHGSAITYARRYALAAIVGIAPEDDDAEAAMGRNQPVKVNEVTKVDYSPKKTTEIGEHVCDWRVSQYNVKQEYCAKCKVKRDRSA